VTIARDSFCSSCGAPYADTRAYPRTCGACARQIWVNPTPVAVILVPVTADARVGLLVVRRAIPPGIGRLALPGGFIEEHEPWQVGGAREVREETGVALDPAKIQPLFFASSEPRPNRVLLFGLAEALDLAAIGAFAGDAESSERGLVFGAAGLVDVFAFPLHAEVAARFFDSRGISGAHAFVPV
jgi:ADP-ribose pyrophosphatase YjhB (NUDIX family)